MAHQSIFHHLELDPLDAKKLAPVKEKRTLLPDHPAQPTFERLAELAKLGPNWDSYGAESISSHAIAVAYQLLFAIYSQISIPLKSHIQPFAAPLSDGGIQLEWKGKRASLAVQIAPEGTFGYLLTRGGAPNQFYEEDDDVPGPTIISLVASVLRDEWR